ncbi:hypothetical protein NKJ13_31145 [Mesorhizobium sp. M0174]|uniref:hypothetical protein n=1 Tax=Mesorhizobium sp. M0174 TaxID=2956904 RepID=UPI0033378933
MYSGDSWLEKGRTCFCSSAIGLALIENGCRVLFTRTTDLVQKLQTERRDLALESALAKLDKFHSISRFSMISPTPPARKP